jgi:hypothetical protein
MYFLSILVKITSIITSLFIRPFKPYVIVPTVHPNITGCKLESDVYLSYNGSERVKITQPPGTIYPYLPSDYQADSYIVVRICDGHETFINDRISVNRNLKPKVRKAILN